MADSITFTAPPTTTEVAQQILAAMAAESGVVTDFNKGSQIRTFAEALGAVAEISGVSAAALAVQVIAYSGMSLFGVKPAGAVPAVGQVSFLTALNNAPPALQDIFIPSGTLMQTLGGIQFQTTTSVTLASGTTGIAAPVIAVDGGVNTNVGVGAISQLLTGVVAPLSVYNFAPTAGGLDAETPSQALTRLAAVLNSLVGGSPVSVANAAVGVAASGSSETVRYSTCYEPFLDPLNPGYGTAVGYTVFVDNGAGSASAALQSAVSQKLNGNFNAGVPAFRPSGVPYTVQPVTPVFADVVVTGTLGPLSNPAQINSAIATAVSGYFSLPFGTPAQQATIAAAVSDAALGQLTSFTVSLYYHSASGVAVPTVSGAVTTRVLLNNLTLTIS